MNILVHSIAATMLVLTASHGSSLSAHHAWFRYLDSEVPAGAYVTLDNAGPSPVILIGASSPACGMLMLHESVSRNGVDSMHAVSSVSVPAHGTFAFSPGHYHLMCTAPKMHVGENVPVRLTFKDGTTLTAAFPVFGPAGPPH